MKKLFIIIALASSMTFTGTASAKYFGDWSVDGKVETSVMSSIFDNVQLTILFPPNANCSPLMIFASPSNNPKNAFRVVEFTTDIQVDEGTVWSNASHQARYSGSHYQVMLKINEEILNDIKTGNMLHITGGGEHYDRYSLYGADQATSYARNQCRETMVQK